MKRERSKTGFTLIELLLVIAIIGTLVALLLPAIQMARESARRSSCVNNLKQIGLATSNYESTHKAFPAGAVWGRWDVPADKMRLQGNFLMFILPYIEESALYSQFDFKQLST